MKHSVTLFAWLLALVMPGVLLGRENADRLTPKAYRLVRNDSFEQAILDASFANTGSSRGRLYPAMIQFPAELGFFDSSLKRIRNVKLDSGYFPRVIFSSGGRYVGIRRTFPKTELPAQYQEKDIHGSEVLTILDEQGDSVGKVEKPWTRNPDSPSLEFLVSDRDHTSVSAVFATNRLTFFSGSGELESEVDIFDTQKLQATWIGTGGYSPDGRSFLAVTSREFATDWQKMPADDTPLVYAVMYDNLGKERWRRPLNSGNVPATAQAVSASGRYACAGNERRERPGLTRADFYLFRDRGRLVRTYSVLDSFSPYAPFCRFSPDEKYLALANANRLMLIETGSGKVVLNKTFPWTFNPHAKHYGYIGGLDLSDNADVIAVASVIVDHGTTRRVSHRLDIIDRRGAPLLKEYEVQPNQIALWSEGTRAVWMSPDARRVALRTRNGFRYFEPEK